MPILSFFFLKDGRRIRDQAVELFVDGPKRDLLEDVLADINLLLAQYMRAFRWTKAGGMQDLGVLKGGNSSRAFSINASRRVVGTSASATGDRAFVWDPEAGMKDLNLAIRADQGLVLVEAHLINNRGQIVAMGARREHSTDHVPAAADADVCAPAPPVLYLLTPSDQVLSFGH